MKQNRYQRYFNYIPKEEMVKSGKIRMDLVKGGSYKANDEIEFINGIYDQNKLRKARIASVEPINIDKNGIWLVKPGETQFQDWESPFVENLAIEHGTKTAEKLKIHLQKLYDLKERNQFQVIRW